MCLCFSSIHNRDVCFICSNLYISYCTRLHFEVFPFLILCYCSSYVTAQSTKCMIDDHSGHHASKSNSPHPLLNVCVVLFFIIILMMQTIKNPSFYNLCCHSEVQYLDSSLQGCFTDFSSIFICVAQRLLKYLPVQPEKSALVSERKLGTMPNLLQHVLMFLFVQSLGFCKSNAGNGMQ